MPEVVEVQPESEYKLRLKFADGEEGKLDFSDKVGEGVYSAWSDRSVFNSVQVTDSGNIAWSNGVDMCADALYLKITGKAPGQIFDSSVIKTKSA